jgi:hypothetical protein
VLPGVEGLISAELIAELAKSARLVEPAVARPGGRIHAVGQAGRVRALPGSDVSGPGL